MQNKRMEKTLVARADHLQLLDFATLQDIVLYTILKIAESKQPWRNTYESNCI